MTPFRTRVIWGSSKTLRRPCIAVVVNVPLHGWTWAVPLLAITSPRKRSRHEEDIIAYQQTTPVTCGTSTIHIVGVGRTASAMSRTRSRFDNVIVRLRRIVDTATPYPILALDTRVLTGCTSSIVNRQAGLTVSHVIRNGEQGLWTDLGISSSPGLKQILFADVVQINLQVKSTS